MDVDSSRRFTKGTQLLMSEKPASDIKPLPMTQAVAAMSTLVEVTKHWGKRAELRHTREDSAFSDASSMRGVGCSRVASGWALSEVRQLLAPLPDRDT